MATQIIMPKEPKPDPPLRRQIQCQHCHSTLDPDEVVKAMGEKYILAKSSRILNSYRVNPKGPPQVIRVCTCGLLMNAREARAHRCPQRPPRGQESKATEQETKAYELGARKVKDVQKFLNKRKAQLADKGPELTEKEAHEVAQLLALGKRNS